MRTCVFNITHSIRHGHLEAHRMLRLARGASSSTAASRIASFTSLQGISHNPSRATRRVGKF